MTIVLVSWNVHGWVGADRRRDPERCLETVVGFEADVVALQEVEGTGWERAAHAAGFAILQGPTTRASYGNALLARAPFESARRIDLSVSGRETRGALDASLRFSHGPLRVLSTHFGLRAGERRRQAARLARHIETRDAELPVVVLGDFNDWTPWAGHLAPIARVVGPLSRLATFPSRRPILSLDRVGHRVPGFAPRVEVLRGEAVRRASDHLPLRLVLTPDRAGDPAGDPRVELAQ